MNNLPNDIIFNICRYLRYPESKVFKNISLPIDRMVLNSEFNRFFEIYNDEKFTTLKWSRNRKNIFDSQKLRGQIVFRTICISATDYFYFILKMKKRVIIGGPKMSNSRFKKLLMNL